MFSTSYRQTRRAIRRSRRAAQRSMQVATVLTAPQSVLSINASA